MITMYYDDKCPVCRTEALHMADKKPNDIHIIPIHQAVDELATYGISELDAMTYLCVKDSNDSIYKGMDAVRLLYKTAELPIARTFNLPIVKQASEVIYPIFARHRNRIPRWITKLAYGKVADENSQDCEDGICSLPPDERLVSYQKEHQDKTLAK